MVEKPGRRRFFEEKRVNANKGRIDLRLEALERIKRRQLRQNGADLKRIYGLSADKNGFGASILRHELQIGFLKSVKSAGPKERHCLELADNTLRIELLLWKHGKQVPLKQAIELYQAAHFVLETGKIAARGNAGKFNALNGQSANIADSIAELQAAVKRKETGSMILKPGNFLQIASLGDSLLGTAAQRLKPEIRLGFAEIGRIAMELLVKKQ